MTDIQSLLYVYDSFGKVPKAVVDIGWKIRKFFTYMTALEKSLKLWLILAGRSRSPD